MLQWLSIVQSVVIILVDNSIDCWWIMMVNYDTCSWSARMFMLAWRKPDPIFSLFSVVSARVLLRGLGGWGGVGACWHSLATAHAHHATWMTFVGNCTRSSCHVMCARAWCSADGDNLRSPVRSCIVMCAHVGNIADDHNRHSPLRTVMMLRHGRFVLFFVCCCSFVVVVRLVLFMVVFFRCWPLLRYTV